jgi:hypothetical protein
MESSVRLQCFPQLLVGQHKERKRTKKEGGRPVETAASVEIDKGGLRRLLIDDFHKLP